MMSTWLLQIAINGLSQSPSPTPVARSRLRWAARASPRLIVSERIVWLSDGRHGGSMVSIKSMLADDRGPAKLWNSTLFLGALPTLVLAGPYSREVLPEVM